MNEKPKSKGISWYKLWLFAIFLGCLSIFAFYHKHVLDLKIEELSIRDEKIALLEQQLANLKQYGEMGIFLLPIRRFAQLVRQNN